MIETGLFFLLSAALLLFGVFLSAAFSGVRQNKRNALICLAFSAVSGAAQILLYLSAGEDPVRKFYPILVHLPTVLLLRTVFGKRLITSIAAVTTAYLLCQPAKWIGLLGHTLFQSQVAEYAVHLISLTAGAFLFLRYLAETLAEVFGKDTRSVCIFGITPAAYYLFDYVAVVYNDWLYSGNLIVFEFLPFFLSVVFTVFCIVYYRTYEKQADAERKEQIVRITVAEQRKELDAVRRSEKEVRIMRHDMRLLLGNLSACLENGDIAAAKKIIASHVEGINATVVEKYCENATVNYILSDFAQRCRENGIRTDWQVQLVRLDCDEVLLSTILSNALDNAIKAQLSLPAAQRRILLLLKQQNGRLLLSVKNPFLKKPQFADGLPLSERKGHGYGTQSIRYLTERMGGNCQFTTENDQFVLRVVI